MRRRDLSPHCAPLRRYTRYIEYLYPEGHDYPEEGVPKAQYYLWALYWSLTTLTTVGYGDITPANDAERTFANFALLIGALIFGLMISQVSTLVASLDRQAALVEAKLDSVKE